MLLDLSNRILTGQSLHDAVDIVLFSLSYGTWYGSLAVPCGGIRVAGRITCTWRKLRAEQSGFITVRRMQVKHGTIIS